MRWIEFADGSSYTFAADIQKSAEMHGYVVPCEQDGTRHPGTDCNQKLRSIFKDTGMRRTFKLTDKSVVIVKSDDLPVNKSFIEWLVDNGIVSSYYSGKGAINLYTMEAVNALLSVMLNTHVEYERDEDDEYIHCPIFPTKRSHNLEKKKNRPKVSLFNQ